MALKIKRARVGTAPFPFHRLSPDPKNPITLHVRYLFTSKGYVDATFTRKPVVDKEGYDLAVANREQELQDIAAFCAVRWDNAFDDDGKPVECTPENVLATLKQALENGYDDEINELRVFVKMLANFRSPLADGQDLGKE